MAIAATAPHNEVDVATPAFGNADDRIYPATRVVAGLLVVILAVGASLLYVWPLETETRFAWPITPAMTPLLMGSGYFAGAYYFLRLAIGRNWTHVGATLPAVAIFATVMLVTTIIHWDRFTHDHLAFYIWTVVYIIAPPLVVGIWYWNSKRDPGDSEAGSLTVPGWVRAVVAVLGLGAVTLAAMLFFAPETASDVWPWAVSPFTSRVLAGWFMLTASTSLLLARDARWSIWRVPLQTTVIWAVLMLAGVGRAWSDFDTGNLATWLFLVGVVSVAVTFLLFYLYMEAVITSFDRQIQRQALPCSPRQSAHTTGAYDFPPRMSKTQSGWPNCQRAPSIGNCGQDDYSQDSQLRCLGVPPSF